MSHIYNGSLRHYHKLLYTNTMDNLEETDELLEMYNLPRLNQEEIVKRNRLIVSNEADLYTHTHTHTHTHIKFAVEYEEALYTEQKQDWELTVAQIMKFLLQNSDLN